MKLCLLILVSLFGFVYTQNCIYTSHCAVDVCPVGSEIHCLDSRCKCLQSSNVVPTTMCRQKTDCPIGVCQTGTEIHCMDAHCKCLVITAGSGGCNHDDECVALHDNNKHCGPADDDGRWKCHDNTCQCDHSD